MRTLEEPLRQIAYNAGLESSVIVNDVRKAKAGFGLNAAMGEIVDLVAAGVIDPAMVTRSTLQNAASIGKNILTTRRSSPSCLMRVVSVLVCLAVWVEWT